MAELLFKRAHHTLADAEKDRRGVHKKGDLINIKPDGWAATWPNGMGKYPEKFVCVRCPEISVEEALAADYRGAWRDDFAFEVVSTATSEITLRVWNTNTSATGLAALTREKIEAFLLRWGCNAISIADGVLTFTFRLWPAAQSEGFWDIDDLVAKVGFTLLGYDAASRVATIRAEVLAAAITEAAAVRVITARGGTVTQAAYPLITYTLERNTVVEAFKAAVKAAAETVYKRHRWSISAANVDTIAAAGGIVTRTRAQVLAALIDALES